MAAFDICDLSFCYPQESAPALENISMEIPEGGITLICGASGSGKSTLLRRLKSCLADHGTVQGSIRFFGRELDKVPEEEQAERIGFVFQHPDDQIVTDKVFHELAFGPESLGRRQEDMRLAIAELASFFGISYIFEKSISELSGGQKQLLNLASAVAMHPDVLILDEPTSQLDPIAAADFLSALRRLNEEMGLTIVLTEHRLEEALPMANMLAVLENGRLIACGKPSKAVMQLCDRPIFASMPTAVKVFSQLGGTGDAPLSVKQARVFLSQFEGRALAATEKNKIASEPIVTLKNCCFRYGRELPDVLRGFNLTLRRGEIYALVGGNGSGKSTSLGVISGRLRPYRGRVECGGCTIAALPQDPRELLTEKTVLSELEEMGGSVEDTRHVISLLGLDGVLQRHPFDISGDEQQRCAIAKVLLTKPDVLLLDEPTKGMDGQMKQHFGRLLGSLKGEEKAILTVSHDIEFAAQYADRCGLLFRGEIVTENSPREFFSGNYFYTTAAAKLGRGIAPGAVVCGEVVQCLKK